MGVDAACCPQVRTRFSPARGRPLRKAHHPFHRTRRYNAHAEVWLDSTLLLRFQSLPAIGVTIDPDRGRLVMREL